MDCSKPREVIKIYKKGVIMTDDEIKNKQEETLNNLKKYNKERKTEIVDDKPETREQRRDRLAIERRDNDEPSEYTDIEVDAPESEWIEEQFGQLPEPITEITGDSVNPVMEKQPMQEWLDESDRLNKERGITVVPTPICEFCGNFAYQGQLHGMGYCREKIQYEQ
jgi:hypothetical protein